MDNGPSASVDVLISHILHVSVQFKFEKARGKDMHSSWCFILNDHH